MLEIGLVGLFIFHGVACFLLFFFSFMGHRVLKFGATYYAIMNFLLVLFMFVLDKPTINMGIFVMVGLVSIQFAVLCVLVDGIWIQRLYNIIQEKIHVSFEPVRETPNIPFHATIKEETCPICLTHPAIPISIYKCEHPISCLACIGGYLESNLQVCPICRALKLGT